jgi:hypothetical protein
MPSIRNSCPGNIRAVVVLPVLRIPVMMNACAVADPPRNRVSRAHHENLGRQDRVKVSGRNTCVQGLWYFGVPDSGSDSFNLVKGIPPRCQRPPRADQIDAAYRVENKR